MRRAAYALMLGAWFGCSDPATPDDDDRQQEEAGGSGRDDLDAGRVDARAARDGQAPVADSSAQRDSSTQRDSSAQGDGSAQRDGSAPLDASTMDAGDARVDAAAPSLASLGEPGPFATLTPVGQVEGPSCSLHRPATLGKDGFEHPVIIWGMGTGGFNTYQANFELWASHGFIVAAATLGNGQGDGAEMLACLDYVCEQYAPHVDCRAGASGHSQGGGGAIMAGQDERVITTAPIQPYIAQGFGGFDRASIAKQRGPMLLLSGTNDTVSVPAQHQQPVFDGIEQPVVWANFKGGDHVVTGIDGAASYRNIVLAWFRVQLLDDERLRPLFYGPNCAVCMDPAWIVQRRGVD